MMNAVGCDPGDWPAFERQGATDRQKVFDPLFRLEGTMRQQPVIAHADPQAQSNPIETKRGKECRPVEKEEGGNGPKVKRSERKRRDPVDASPFQDWPYRSIRQNVFFLEFERAASRGLRGARVAGLSNYAYRMAPEVSKIQAPCPCDPRDYKSITDRMRNSRGRQRRC